MIMIEVSELSFYTAEGRAIFDGLHLRVEMGEWVNLLGPRGSGKTVLLKLLFGELKPHRGQILVDERNVTRLSPAKLLQLRRELGIVPEEPLILAQETVLAGLAFKLRALGLGASEATQKAAETLELLGLAHSASRSPQELNPVEQALSQLALAICHDPILLLADEPCRGLKEEEAIAVLQALDRVYRRKRLTILLAAEKGIAGFGTRTVLLKDGRLEGMK